MEIEKIDNSIIVQSNVLLNSHYQMSMLEMRIFLFMMSKIQVDDEDFKEYNLSVKEIISDLNLKGKSLYENIQKATLGLMKRIFTIFDETKTVNIAMLSKTIYWHKKGILTLRFDSDLKPYLLQLKENFTISELEQVLKFRSMYSIRIYFFLKQYEDFGRRRMTVEELRQKLCLEEKYDQYNDFKKRVVERARMELEESDLPFTFTEIKTGREITSLEFRFKKKKKAKQIEEAIPEVLTATDESTRIENIKQALKKMGLVDKQIEKILQVGSLQEIGKIMHDIQIKNLDKKIQNLGAYAYQSFKNAFDL